MKKKKLLGNKRGAVFDQLTSVFISLAVIGVVLVVAFLVMAEAQDQIVSIDSVDESNTSTMTTAYNASQALQSATEGSVDWIPIIVVVLIGGILIGLVSVFTKR